jgi:RHS repeat-associated protein
MQKLDAAGEVAMSVAYDAFGQLTSGQLVGEYGFSSKPRITGINWYYYGFRYYDPETGRWPNRDPIEEAGGLNLYAMVLNNPISYADYLGLKICKTEIFIGHGGGGDSLGSLEKPLETRKNAGQTPGCGDTIGLIGCFGTDNDSFVTDRFGDDALEPGISDLVDDVKDHSGYIYCSQLKSLARKAIEQAKANAKSKCNKSPDCCTRVRIKVKCLYGGRPNAATCPGASSFCDKTVDVDCN